MTSANPRRAGVMRGLGNVIPPAGPAPAVCNGSDGDDWKWRRVAGLDKAGVDGTPFGFAGVTIVKLNFPSLRFGGVGGFTNAGEAGADNFNGSCGCNGAVAKARPRPYDAEVLTAKFLRLRGRFDASVGLCCTSKTGRVGSDSADLIGDSIGVNRDSLIGKDMEVGDCGEGPGEGSVMLVESSETVVVGEESADSEADVDVLCLG